MKSAHQYKRRTYDEARTLAMTAVREQIRAHLPPETIEEMRGSAIEGGGSVLDGWEAILGSEPDRRMHYEFCVYQPSDKHPFISKYYFRALASRDRTEDRVWIMWQPPMPDYPQPPEPPRQELPEGYVLIHD
jgi:hypothetical protein